jgi:hypothetical protein
LLSLIVVVASKLGCFFGVVPNQYLIFLVSQGLYHDPPLNLIRPIPKTPRKFCFFSMWDMVILAGFWVSPKHVN